MTIPFNGIPSNVRVPLFYAEMDNSQAIAFDQNLPALLIGQKLAAGAALAGEVQQISSTDQAKTLFGVGSMLARMVEKYRKADPFGDLYAIAVADNGAGVAATGTISLTGPATASGTLALTIAGQPVKVGVASGDTATAVATALAAAINALSDLPVTATSAAGVVTLNARWKGDTGNDITVFLNFRGQAGGEATPVGLVVTIVAMATGATNPDISAAITAMGDDPYEFILHPYTDTGTLDLLKTEMGDSSGRWSWLRQVYGHAYSCKRGTQTALTTFGLQRNDQHATVAGFEADVPHPCWEEIASFGGRTAVFIRNDPARPTQTGELTGLLSARPGKRFTTVERQNLLNSGIATIATANGVQLIERAITTYQKNTFGQVDPSYLDSETLHTSAYVLRRMRYVITQKYARHKLANDGTRFGAGQAIVTPAIIRGELIALYKQLELEGIVENAAAFAAHLIVERDTNNPNRVNVLFPPDYVNQFRILAVLNQFRLNY